MFLDDVVGPMSVKEAKRLSGADKFRKTISDIEAKHKPAEERYNRLKSDPAYREQEFQKWQKEVHGDKAVKEDSWHAGDNAWSSDNHEMVEAQLSVGDPVVVTAPNEFEGKTGEISEFSPSGSFVIVNLYNHGKHSMHLSDVEYNKYADEEDEIDETIRKLGSQYRLYSGKGKNLGTFPTRAGAEKHEREVQYFKHADEGVEEGVVVAGPGREVNDKTVRKMVWDVLKINADTGEQAIQRALSVLAKKPQSRSVQNLQDTLIDLKARLVKGVDETVESSPVAGAITRRILQQRIDLLKQYGPELVGAAVDDVADYVGDVDEIGSSDVSGWVAQVERMLEENPPEAFAEGFQDFNKVEPYAVCLAGRPVKKFDYYEDARRFHDNWKKKLYNQGEKAKADKITLMPLNLDEAMNKNDLLGNVAKDLNTQFKKAKPGKLKASGDFTKGDHWQGAKPGDYGYTGYQGHGMPTDRAERERIRADKKKGVAEGTGPQSKLDQKIIHLLTNGIPVDVIARKLDIPVEWVHEVAEYNMPDSTIDYNDPRNSTQGRERFGEQGVAEDTGSWIVYDPETKQIKKRFKTHTAGKSYAQTHNLGFASSEYYFDNIKEQELTETALNPRDPRGDYAAKRKALQDLGMNKDVDQAAVLQRRLDLDREAKAKGVAEEWSKKYKSSINCSHPKGFSQKAHCAGKKKHNESVDMEMVCEDCGMCQTHGSLNEIAKGQKDSNGYTRCWPGKHAEGTKRGKNGGQVRNCVPNEGVAEAETDFSKRRKRERDIDAGRPVKPLPKNPQTDYARKRARDRKEMELGESYWTKLQRERSTKLNTLVNELKETIK